MEKLGFPFMQLSGNTLAVMVGIRRDVARICTLIIGRFPGEEMLCESCISHCSALPSLLGY
jgi:hypothetical protein